MKIRESHSRESTPICPPRELRISFVRGRLIGYGLPMNKSLIFGLQREILAALGCVALMSPACVGDDGSSSSSEGTTDASTGTDGGSSASTGGSTGESATSTSGSGTEGSGTSGTEGTGTSGTEGTGTSGTEGTGTSGTDGTGTSTGSTGTSGTEGTGSSTGGGGVCDPPPPPLEGYTQEFVCFQLPEGLESCAECDDVCSRYNVGAVITGDPDFCAADGLILQCGPDVEAEPMSCCFWAAYTGIVCEGRPLLVDGLVRAAPICSRGDWLAESQEEIDDRLDAPTREALASAWAEDARMEHASIAAFARLVLHLMAVAAPADLVVGAQAALADEIEHARVCFSLASAYRGRALGPGRLSLEGALEGVPTLTELAVAAVVEGCVGETIAASIARVSAERARDPAVRTALAKIAADESRHAAFSWRLVRWTLEVGDSTLKSAVAEAFAGAMMRPPKAREQALGVDIECWTAHGRLTSKVEAAVIRDTLREVIEPCSRTLLGQVNAVQVQAQAHAHA